LTRLEFSPLAQADLETIGDYISQDSPGNAIRFIEGLRTQCEKITRAPMVYAARPELADGLRSCAHERYVIFFLPSLDGLRVVRNLHIAMDANSVDLN
jgi:toxin ParE1/3/4